MPARSGAHRAAAAALAQAWSSPASPPATPTPPITARHRGAAGVYGGAADPLPTLQLFDRQIQVRQGQANVKRWVDDLMPLLEDSDPLGVQSFATHHLPLADAPTAYEKFQKKQDGMIKVVFNP